MEEALAIYRKSFDIKMEERKRFELGYSDLFKVYATPIPPDQKPPSQSRVATRWRFLK